MILSPKSASCGVLRECPVPKAHVWQWQRRRKHPTARTAMEDSLAERRALPGISPGRTPTATSVPTTAGNCRKPTANRLARFSMSCSPAPMELSAAMEHALNLPFEDLAHAPLLQIVP